MCVAQESGRNRKGHKRLKWRPAICETMGISRGDSFNCVVEYRRYKKHSRWMLSSLARENRLHASPLCEVGLTLFSYKLVYCCFEYIASFLFTIRFSQCGKWRKSLAYHTHIRRSPLLMGSGM